ncbi:MAG: gliding motility-associated C-terminal domain-containing protein [Taibaiella sp.]|nr:gliding motility-associated C-terminal domain-containing protein [Taibaiella sp.]
MKKSVLVVLLILLSPCLVRAQAEDNIWAFGSNAALDLNSGSPVSLSGFMTHVIEGTAAISDLSGGLLFYSAGQQVWNRDHNLMPNGSGILGHDGSGTQSTAICKYPGRDRLYYLFTLENLEKITVEESTIGYLRYNIIDMSLDGGKGDVITTEKNIVLDSFMGEKMVVVSDDGCGYWLVTYNYETRAYHSYRITVDGIEPPVISPGENDCGIVGEIKISPDGSKIANAAFIEGDVEVAFFDIATGSVSDFILLNHMSPYGAGFSPNSQVLYINNGYLYQYDLSSFPDGDEVAASEYTHSSGVALSAFRLGTNGKLYFPSTFSSDIYAIHNPDELGAASSLETSAFTLSSGSVVFGLGSSVAVNTNLSRNSDLSIETYAPGLASTGLYSCIRGCAPARFRIMRPDTDLEEEQTVHYLIEGTGVNGTDYEWIPDNVTIPSGSSYADIYIRPQVLSDLQVLRTVSLKILDTLVCSNNPALVAILSDTIVILDSIYISVFPEDAHICRGETIRLQAETNYEDYVSWAPDQNLQPSPNAPVVFVTPEMPISYLATINVPWSGCATEEDNSDISIYNETMEVKLNYEVYNDPVCVYDTVMLIADGGYSYIFLNRFNEELGRGSSNLEVAVPYRYNEYIVLATDENGCMDSAFIQVRAELCCEVLMIPNAFSPNGDGLNDRFGVLTDVYPEDFRLEIFNRWGERVFISYKPDNTWDGTDEEGTPADAGVYFYKVRGVCYDQRVFIKRGDLTLVR